MGDISNMIIEGQMCQSCFMVIPANLKEPPGHPINCEECK